MNPTSGSNSESLAPPAAAEAGRSPAALLELLIDLEERGVGALPAVKRFLRDAEAVEEGRLFLCGCRMSRAGQPAGATSPSPAASDAAARHLAHRTYEYADSEVVSEPIQQLVAKLARPNAKLRRGDLPLMARLLRQPAALLDAHLALVSAEEEGDVRPLPIVSYLLKFAKVACVAVCLLGVALGGARLDLLDQLESFLKDVRNAVEFPYDARVGVFRDRIVCRGKAYAWIVHDVLLTVTESDGTPCDEKRMLVGSGVGDRHKREFGDGESDAIQLRRDGKTRRVTVTVNLHPRAAKSLAGAKFDWMTPAVYLAECTPRGILISDFQAFAAPRIIGIRRVDAKTIAVRVRKVEGGQAAVGVAYWNEAAPEQAFCETSPLPVSGEEVEITIQNVPQEEKFRFQPYLLPGGERAALERLITGRKSAEGLLSGAEASEAEFSDRAEPK